MSQSSATPSGVDHVFLTRFNLPSVGVESLVRAQDGWLRRRVDLFERYTLPSMAAQTTQDFGWLVYFDVASPDWLRERIERWTADGRLTAAFAEEVPAERLVQDLERVSGRRNPELLTTNLDNDDGLALDFAARVQAAPATGTSALYLINGLIATTEGVWVRTDRRNAFCSVRTLWSDPRTCWAEWHNLLGETMPVVEIPGPPGWLQVVHGGNVSNRVRGGLTSPRRHRDRFPGLLEDVPEPGTPRLVADRIIRRPLRGARDAGRVTAKRVVIRLIGRNGLERAKLALAGVRHRT